MEECAKIRNYTRIKEEFSRKSKNLESNQEPKKKQIKLAIDNQEIMKPRSMC